ncbi:uncharacterized protein Z520_03311 [Fonsecaea multimorphosa CBS 102226]|uniref:Major facilitator superfamily (MFS) profile domain-containing protein n=1 Tax=Fonsecaea multimorphosa CBS 102226 TaxID=1442371 RepID=A0A0D2K496_9EURO|nr:uncharacterized protein Z520_03311 [Fonsecaea multimorphosa CBS 102226]KIY00648.1 hypothetical protein Z520_03311 [Fonsecaea multimorphosa CBS 102226]OAL19037.1 hypothetical protein AYO22_10366 [Fonsecaea multimorphosa]
METLETKRRPYTWKTVFICIGAAWASAAMGYAANIGTTLGQPSFIKHMHLDTASNASGLLGAINGLYYAGAFIGALCAGPFSNRYGRKVAIGTGVVFILVSNALLAASVDTAMFIAFRFFQGFGCAVQLTQVPLYISEIVPPKDRGVLCDLHAIFLNVGNITSAYIGVGFFYDKSQTLNEWTAPTALGCLYCVFSLVSLWFIPESPRYLLLRGKPEQAWEIVRTLHHGAHDHDETFAQNEFRLMRTQTEYERMHKMSFLQMLKRPSYRKRVGIACGLPFLAISSGVLVINNYGALLYAGLGMDAEQQIQLQAGWLAVSFTMNTLAVLVVERLPRPHLMSIGMGGACCALIIECAIQAVYLGSDHKAALAAGVAMLYVFVFFFAGFLDGPMYFYAAEIFPTHLRAQATSMAMASFCLSNIIWLQAAPTAFANIGWHYYLIFIILAAVGTALVFFTFPDTRNLALEEVARLFGDEVYDGPELNSPSVVLEEKTPATEQFENTNA